MHVVGTTHDRAGSKIGSALQRHPRLHDLLREIAAVRHDSYFERYFYQMGEAVLANEGFIDKYIGDGMMALFGMNISNPETNCPQRGERGPADALGT